MEQASIPLYIRFGEIPKDGISHIHRGDQVIRAEGGLSVWRAITDGRVYYPMLPSDANDNAIADYFDQLLEGDQRVYLVTGREIGYEGADREPLIKDPIIIKEITTYIHPKRWNKDHFEEMDKRTEDCVRSEMETMEEKNGGKINVELLLSYKSLWRLSYIKDRAKDKGVLLLLPNHYEHTLDYNDTFMRILEKGDELRKLVNQYIDCNPFTPFIIYGNDMNEDLDIMDRRLSNYEKRYGKFVDRYIEFHTLQRNLYMCQNDYYFREKLLGANEDE